MRCYTGHRLRTAAIYDTKRKLGRSLKMNHKSLAEELQVWFCEVKAMPEWVRCKSPVWSTMRDNLRLLGNWKNRPRGNPKRGYLVSRKNMKDE